MTNLNLQPGVTVFYTPNLATPTVKSTVVQLLNAAVTPELTRDLALHTKLWQPILS